MCLKYILDGLENKGFAVQGIRIKADDLFFEERVRMNCFYCGKYSNNWKCPPRIPELDYRKLFYEYDNLAFIYVKYNFEGMDFQAVRRDSSVYLHKALLECERLLFGQGYPMAISFIGGSCKLCRDGCSKDGCANPYYARSPIEATGVNVIKSIKKYGISVTFPPNDCLYRIGLLCW